MEKITKRTIAEFSRQIAQQFHPHKVILFGSYAYGKPTRDSDVDILVILPFEGRNPKKATEIWLATRSPFPVDLLVRKPEEVKQRLVLTEANIFFPKTHELTYLLELVRPVEPLWTAYAEAFRLLQTTRWNFVILIRMPRKRKRKKQFGFVRISVRPCARVWDCSNDSPRRPRPHAWAEPGRSPPTQPARLRR